MAQFVNDTFTDTNGTTLTSHTGEAGATWATHPSFGALAQIRSNRLGLTTASTAAAYYSSGIPASGEYDLEWDIVLLASNATDFTCELYGRFDTTVNTHYDILHDRLSNQWTLRKVISSSGTTLATAPQTLSTNTTYRVKFSIRDYVKIAYVDGVEIARTNDNSITGAGRGGLLLTMNSVSDTTGPQIDNYSATDVNSSAIIVPNLRPLVFAPGHGR